MPVIRIILLVIVSGLGISFSGSASAAPVCWNGSGTTFSFGTVTAGQAASTSGNVVFTCNHYDASTEYVRACLFLQDNSPSQMNPNGVSGYPLYFNVYAQAEPDLPLGANSSNYAQLDYQLSNGQQLTQYFNLLARIPSGQTKLKPYDYYKYDLWSNIKYSYASSASQLPSCASMPQTTMLQVQLSANTAVKNGCMIDNVDDLNFGQHSPATSSSLSGTSTSKVTISCPADMPFSVGLGNGLHSQQSVRYLCNSTDNQCVSYQLYQDAAHSIPWSENNTETVLSATGSSQSLTVYGVVPVQSWPSAGDYSDTVTVTLNY